MFFRRNNISVDFDYLDRSIKAQMREANRVNSKYVLFFGGEEYEHGTFLLKNMKSGDQKELKLSQLDIVLDLLKVN